MRKIKWQFLVLLIIAFSCQEKVDPIEESISDPHREVSEVSDPTEIFSLLNEANKKNKSLANLDKTDSIFQGAEWSKARKLMDYENKMVVYSVPRKTNSPSYKENIQIGKKGDDFKVNLVRYIPEKGWLSRNSFENDILNFSGRIEYHSQEGVKIGEVILASGKALPPKSYTTCHTYSIDLVQVTISMDLCGGEVWDVEHVSIPITICESFGGNGSENDNHGNDSGDSSGGSGGFGPIIPLAIPSLIYDAPCPGDPLPRMEIASQERSGVDGGLHDTCTRSSRIDVCNPSRRLHNGVDLKNDFGNPIYAVLGGYATKHSQVRRGRLVGAGYYVSVTSQVNGETIRMVYFHLQKENRAEGYISAGDIIGYQGDSGNLKGAIKSGYTESHVHIKAEKNGIKVDPLIYFTSEIDKSTGKAISSCN